MKNKTIEEMNEKMHDIIDKDKPLTERMSEVALFMRPQLNGKQVTEVIERTLDEFEEHEPDGTDYIIMRVEFHADDVLGFGDEEYAYTGFTLKESDEE